MTVRSAAVLLHRPGAQDTEVWIAHMGGPFWARKNEGAWSLPKGIVEDADRDELAAALREFAEEMGVPAPDAAYVALGEFRASGKVFVVWAAETPDFELAEVRSNTFELEWPPRSGRTQAFPEIDAAGWFALDEAVTKLAKGQRPILEALRAVLATGEGA
ncbi:NUDIX domain-containing protein [Leifsonia sp. ZF2019]|uniref:NUDIX domain-containing protein n=1 Tax=Leifsonia sp. ZF2019 TaxID=2781978 RepID=UPI001CBD9D97|nr:NUDIX domain-containing protein [Leifsonia sp. ZF2019]UAJ77771.1 NUDIX domain-containing protein [Leifsonia sp. ZF2019]